MATVPAAQQSVAPQNVSPQYQSPGGATIEVFGGGAANGALQGGKQLLAAGDEVGSLAASMADAQRRIQARKEYVGRSLVNDALDGEANKLENDYKTTKNMADPDIVTSGFARDISGLRDKYVAEHAKSGASQESQQLLYAELNGKVRAYTNRMADESLKAQNQVVTGTIGKKVNAGGARIAENPQMLGQELVNMEDEIGRATVVIGVPEAQKQIAGIRSQYVQTAVHALEDAGDLKNAKLVLDHFGKLGYLKPEELVGANASIATKSLAEERYRNEGQHKIEVASQVSGIPIDKMTAEQRLRAAGIQGPVDAPEQKLAALQHFMGPGYQITPDDIRRATVGVGASQNDQFGGVYGKSLTLADHIAPAIIAGTAGEADMRQFSTAMAQLLTPQRDPVSNRLENPPILPPHITAALQAHPELAPQYAGPTGPGVRNANPAAAGSFQFQSPDTVPNDGQRPGSTLPPNSYPNTGNAPANTLYSANEKGWVTGPVPALAGAVGRVPMAGEAFSTSQMTQARQRIPMMQAKLDEIMADPLGSSARTLIMKSPAAARGINLEPSVGDSAKAYRDRLIAIDSGLADVQKNAAKVLAEGKSSGEELNKAQGTLNDVRDLRGQLGLPPWLSPADAKKLPPGAQFIDEDGVIRTRHP